eukprot:m.160464 g.160464  ORF g.160464 m.160464 type:complete len:64 (-) comp15168_c0_seq11:681-872(-)
MLQFVQTDIKILSKKENIIETYIKCVQYYDGSKTCSETTTTTKINVSSCRHVVALIQPIRTLI